MSEIVLEARNVSKRYQLGEFKFQRDSQTAAWVRRVVGLKSEPSTNTFWALNDVSFTVNQGEILGLLGRNGAGKSTLLKILASITRPTQGTLRFKGKVASLIGIGTGFHPDLTGRENIYLNGAILGMRRREITKNFDAIVDFSQLGKFLDTPVKRYSSGMYMRLGFAVAAFLDAAILAIDEVLAVGDAEFQHRCVEKMREIALSGRTVLLVSHDLHVVSGLATKCILLQSGRVAHSGDAPDVIETYISQGHQQEGELILERHGAAGAFIDRIALKTSAGKITNRLSPRDPIRVEIDYEVPSSEGGAPHLLVSVGTSKGLVMGEINSHEFSMFAKGLPDGKNRISIEIENVLRAGHYHIQFAIHRNGKNLLESRDRNAIFNFEILRAVDQTLSWAPQGPIHFETKFQISPSSAALKKTG